jgi:hypothetical protein
MGQRLGTILEAQATVKKKQATVGKTGFGLAKLSLIVSHQQSYL